MKINVVFFIILLFFTAGSGYAQEGLVDPCGKGFVRTITKAQIVNGRINWEAFVTGCDALVVASDSAYKYLIVEREYYKGLNGKLDSLVGELDLGQSLRDSMIGEQKSFIVFQQGVIGRYDSLLVQSHQLVKDATANTDRALRQLTLLKWASIGGITIGLVGVLAVAAAND